MRYGGDDRTVWIRVSKAAQMMEVDRRTALGMAKDGTIRYKRIGMGKHRATYRLYRADCEAQAGR